MFVPTGTLANHLAVRELAGDDRRVPVQAEPFMQRPRRWLRRVERLQSRGVRFTEAPREQSYGTVVAFLDLHGNKWDLVQRRTNEAPKSI